MKKVYQNNELPHLWAHQQQEFGRNSNQSFWFEGAQLYSYRTEIMRHAKLPNSGVPVVLYGDACYSSTTGRHRSAAFAAIPHDVLKYPVVAARRGERLNAEDVLQAIVTRQKEMIKYELNQAVKPRIKPATREGHLSNALAGVDIIEQVYELSLLETPDELRGELHQWVLLASHKDISVLRETLREAEAQRVAAQREADRRRKEDIRFANRAEIEAWQQGGSAWFPAYDLDPFLRIEGDEVVTSHGARVPVSVVAALYDSYKSKGAVDHLVGRKIGPYTIQAITEEVVVIGCHHVPRAEIDRLFANRKVAA